MKCDNDCKGGWKSRAVMGKITWKNGIGELHGSRFIGAFSMIVLRQRHGKR